jgi:hypothetical protein
MNKFDIEIFSAGTWNGDTFSPRDLEDMARNFDELKDKIKPPIKLGHRQLEGQPALGWVEGLRVLGEKLIASVVDVPPIITEAIKRKLYRRVSPEIYFGYKDTTTKKRYNLVVSAVSLLGADIPAVKTLEDLTAYLADLHGESAEKMVAYEFAMNPGPGEHITILNQGGLKAMDEKEFGEKLELAQKEADAKVADEKAAREKAEAELKAYKDEQEKQAREGKVASVKAFCEDLVKTGKMTPAVRDTIFPKDKEGLVEFSEAGEPTIPFSVLKDYAESMKTVKFGEVGSAADDEKKDEAGLDPSAILDKRARELVASKKAGNYSEACKKVLSDDPAFAKEYSASPGKRIEA